MCVCVYIYIYIYNHTYHVYKVNIVQYLFFYIIHSIEFLIDHRSTIDQMTLVQEATILALGTG